MDIREKTREKKTYRYNPRDLDQNKKRRENEEKTPNFVNPFTQNQIIFKKKNKIRCKTVNIDHL